MSQLTHAAGEATQLGWVMGLTTVGFFCFFLGWVVYVALPRQSRALDAMARLPLDDDRAAPGGEL